jgi:hypothetical protein
VSRKQALIVRGVATVAFTVILEVIDSPHVTAQAVRR